MRSSAKGTIVLEGKTAADVKAIRECAEKTMGDNYEVKITELIKPTILISGMNDELSKEEIIECIKLQNNFLENSEIDVISTFSYGKSKKHYSAICKIDSVNFEKIIEQSRVNIYWDKCYVKEFILVKRCFNCFGYNHKADDCSQ